MSGTVINITMTMITIMDTMTMELSMTISRLVGRFVSSSLTKISAARLFRG
jgi:hypothetical protein